MSQNAQARNNTHGFGQMAERAVATYAVAECYKRLAKKRSAGVAEQGDGYDILTDPQYPQDWDEYIGQDVAKSQLQAAVARSKARHEPVRHVLISCGEPGVGKTALAVLLARAIGGKCYAISGTPTAAEVRKIILGMQPGDVLFIDEIHRLVVGGKSKAEWLLHVLQDNCLMGPTGPEKANLDITVVGATTDKGRLPRTVIERFGVQPTLVRYNPDQAFLIALAHCEHVFAPDEIPSNEDIVAMIYAADLNPRKIKQLVEQAVDCMYDPAGYSIDLVLERAGMTIDGLDQVAQRYLVLLQQASGPMGEAQIRSLLQEASLTYTEQRLADKGLITFTKSGRQLTAQGFSRSKELIAEGVTV